MSFLDLSRLDATPLAHDPYDHVMVPGFVRSEALAAIHRSYPAIDKPGSFPVSELSYGEDFAALLHELEGPALRAAIERKFAISLAGRPTIVTVRGRCGDRDGNIHTDSKSKIITLLIYLNEPWESEGGRLRRLTAVGS